MRTQEKPGPTGAKFPAAVGRPARLGKVDGYPKGLREQVLILRELQTSDGEALPRHPDPRCLESKLGFTAEIELGMRNEAIKKTDMETKTGIS